MGKPANPTTPEDWRKKLKDFSCVDDQDCWNHQGGSNSSGYPSVRMFGQKMGVHQAAYIAWNDWEYRPVERTTVIAHTCDNRRCINPMHLFKCTQRENLLDMVRKHRNDYSNIRKIGTANPKAKLNDNLVIWIRKMAKYGVSTRCLADSLSMSTNMISAITRRAFWKHI